MNIDTLRLHLIECDRTSLEVQYAFSQVLEQQRILLEQKAMILAQNFQPDETHIYFCLLEDEISETKMSLNTIRYRIDDCLSTRTALERYYTQLLQ